MATCSFYLPNPPHLGRHGQNFREFFGSVEGCGLSIPVKVLFSYLFKDADLACDAFVPGPNSIDTCTTTEKNAQRAILKGK